MPQAAYYTLIVVSLVASQAWGIYADSSQEQARNQQAWLADQMASWTKTPTPKPTATLKPGQATTTATATTTPTPTPSPTATPRP